MERFRFWIRQDYLFLIEYSRLLALAAARAPDLDTQGAACGGCRPTRTTTLRAA